MLIGYAKQRAAFGGSKTNAKYQPAPAQLVKSRGTLGYVYRMMLGQDHNGNTEDDSRGKRRRKAEKRQRLQTWSNADDLFLRPQASEAK
jgi:hypothetical protein